MQPVIGDDACEVLHGLEGNGTVELPPHIEAQLPPGDLVEYGELVSVVYRWPHDNELYEHEFSDARLLVGGDGVLYVVGSFTTQPEGIINTESR